MKKQSRFLVLVVALAAMVGCSKKSDDNNGPVQTFFVKGDPDELIAGSQRVTENSLTDANFSMWNDYQLMAFYQFVEKEPLVKPSKKEEVQGAGNVLEVSVAKIQSGHWKMTLLSNSLFIDFKNDRRGNLQPVLGTNSKGETIAVEIIHWSRSRERGYVSFLIRIQDADGGKQLVAFYFQPKVYGKVIPKVDPKYKFLAGPGERVGWKTAPEPLTINLCGRGSSDMVRAAVDKWSQVLGSRLPLRYSQTNAYFPFTDLNQHCLYIIDAYISYADQKRANYGAAYTPFSSMQAEIFDSDIFIFESEFRKHGVPSNDYRLKTYWEITLVHELGHFLGLDHQFDGTRSVMSYEFDSTSPQRYDIEAIQALYPLETPRVAQRKR